MTGKCNPAIGKALLDVAIAVVSVADVATPASTRDILKHLRMGGRVAVRGFHLRVPRGKGGDLVCSDSFVLVTGCASPGTPRGNSLVTPAHEGDCNPYGQEAYGAWDYPPSPLRLLFPLHRFFFSHTHLLLMSHIMHMPRIMGIRRIIPRPPCIRRTIWPAASSRLWCAERMPVLSDAT